jgi:hypothetical protein
MMTELQWQIMSYAAAPVLKLLYYSMTGLPQFELTADQKPTMPDADTA